MSEAIAEICELNASNANKLMQARKALRGARLMLYAWRGSRRRMGLADDHTELNNTIAEIEAALSE